MSREFTLIEKSGVSVFRLPEAGRTSKGHYLSTWSDKIWEGKVIITANKNSLKAEFISLDSKIFGSSAITKQWVENVGKCVDSSKGYILAIFVENNGIKKEEKLGVVFRDRKDALHFKMCFSEIDKKVEKEEKLLKNRKSDEQSQIKHRKNMNEEENCGLLENEDKNEQIEEEMKFEVLEDIAKDRYARMLNIQRNMSGVNTLFKEIASLEAQQTEAIVTIEDNVVKAAIKVKESKKELAKTKLIQDKNRTQYCKFLCCTFVALVISIFIIYRSSFTN